MKQNIIAVIMKNSSAGKMLGEHINKRSKTTGMNSNALVKIFLPCLFILAGLLNFSSSKAQCYFENFESGSATGWSNNSVSCGTGFGCFLGRFSHTQSESSLTDLLETQKTFDFSSCTGDIHISFQLNEIDYNDPNNWWSVRLNGTTIIRNQYNGPYGQGGYGGFGSISMDPAVSGSKTTPFGVVDWRIVPMTYQAGNGDPKNHNFGFQSKSDQKHRVEMVIHNPTVNSITMAFYDMLDQGVSDEAFGYDNIYLYRCDPSCNTAGTPADIAVNKTGTATVAPNGTVTYTITATNNSSIDASGTLIADPAVANFTTGTVSCSGSTGGASCPAGLTLANLQAGLVSIYNFPAGSSVSITVTGTAAASGIINNTAIVTEPPGIYDANQANNSSTATTIITSPNADLQTVKSGPATANPNGNVSYTVVFTNNGPSPANNATVSDPAVANFSAGAVTCIGATGGAVCPTSPTISALQAGSLSIPVLPSGGSVTFTVAGTAGASGSILNQAGITAPAGVTDLVSSNNTDTALTVITASADIQVVKSGPATTSPNGSVTYNIIITNNGTLAANNSTVQDAAVANYSAASVSCVSATGGATCPVSPSISALQAGTLAIPNLPNGGSVTLTVTGTAGTSGSIVNTAIVTTPPGVPDNIPGNNTSTAATTIPPTADLQVVKTGPVSTGVNGAVSYTVTVTNNGPVAANNATISDPVVSNFSATNVSCNGATGGASCPASTTLAALQAGTLSIPVLPSGGSVTFLVSGMATGIAGSTINNTSTVTPPAGVTDPNTANNTSTAPTNIINAVADIQAVKSGPDSVAQSGTITYTLTITNNGPASANGATVSDPVVVNFNATSVNCTGATGGATCPVSTTIASLQNGTMTIPVLPSGGSVTLTLSGIATGATGSVITNTVTVTPPGGVTDPVPGNNTSTKNTTIVAGQSATNDCPSSTVDLTTHHNGAVPAGYTLTWHTGTPATAANLVANPTAVGAGTYYASYFDASLNCYGPASPLIVTIKPCNTDLEVVKSGPSAVSFNGTATYNLVIINHGPLAANNATVSDPSVANFSATAVSCIGSTGGAVCPASPSVAALQNGTLIIPTLPAGGAITLAVTGTVTGSAGSMITNIATVTPPPGITDSVPGNNKDTVITNIVSQNTDLEIVKTGPATIAPNGTVTYGLIITNHGPVAANNATVSDPVVANFSAASVSCVNTTGGASCPVNPTIAALQTGSLAIPVLPVGGSITLTVTGTATGSAGSSINNVATVTPPPGVADSVPANNTSNVITNIVGTADVQVVKTGTSIVAANGAVTYNLVISNNGPGAANNTTVSDPVVPNFTATSVTCTATTGGAACPANATVTNLQNGTITVPALPAGATVTLTVLGTAGPVSGTIENIVTVTPPAGTVDPDPTNNKDTAITIITLCPVITNNTNNNVNPGACGATTGSIKICGLTPGGTGYIVNYNKNGNPQAALTNQAADAGGCITISNLGAGSYTNIIVSHPASCPGGNNALSANLSDPAAPVITKGSVQSPTSCGGNDGSITINGLIPGNSYTLNYMLNSIMQTPIVFTAAGSSYVMSSLTAGDYTNITVTSTACNSNPISALLIEPTTATITIGASVNPSVCSSNDGSFTVSGLAPGNTYTLYYSKDGISQTPITFTATGVSYTVNGLVRGTYSNIRVQNSGCTSNMVSVILTDPGAPVIAISSAVQTGSCSAADGSITITGLVAGHTYTLQYKKNGITQTPVTFTAASTSYNLSGLTAGAYTNIRIKEADCTSNSLSQMIIDPGPAVIDFESVNPVPCGNNNGSIVISGLTNGLSYILNYVKDGVQQAPITFIATGNTYVLGSLLAGYYTGINVDQGGCVSNTLDAMLTNPNGAIIDVIPVNAISCSPGNDGKLIITGLSQGVTYTINYSKNGVAQTPITLFSTSTSYIINGLLQGNYTNITATQGVCVSNAVADSIGGPTPVVAPNVDTTLTNTCPVTTADLDDLSASNAPSGTEITWHTGTPASAANAIADPTAVGAGTYYASFYRASTGCYGSTTAVKVTIIPCGADLEIVKTGTVTTTPNGTVTYTLVITNHGPLAANNTKVKDSAVTNFNAIAVSCTGATGGASCPAAVSLSALQAGTLNISTLPAGGTVTLTVTGAATGVSGSAITNIASVTPPAGVTDPTPGNNRDTAVTNIQDYSISGTVYNDVNAGIIDGTPINNPSGQQVYANLVNPVTGLIVGSTPVNSSGNYTLTSANGVQPNTSYNVVLSTTQGIPGTTTGTTSVLPPNWIHTADGVGGTPGDGIPNGILPVITGSGNTTNQDFGIEQPPTAGSGANPATNPGGTSQVPVPSNTFTNITPSGDPAPGCVTAIRITSFPGGATSVVINGTTYTSATFPVAGVVVPTDCSGNPTVPVTVDPLTDTTTKVIIPFVAQDAAGQESPNTGTAVLNFPTLQISGTVHNDINGGTIDGVGINNPSNQPVYANLVNPITGLVVGTTPVNNDGTYTLTAANGVTPNTTFNVVLSTTQGVPGTTTGATPTIPAGWVNTAEGLGGTTGDGTPNGIIPVTTGTTNTTNQDFGIEQPPTAGSGTNTAVNPGGTTQVPVPSNTFTNITPSSDPAPGCVTAIRITSFPGGATSVVINGTTYTSATFPVAGVVVPTDCSGNPTVPVTVDPLTDTTTKVIIPFVAQDAAGQESPNTGTAVLNFPTLQISGTVHNDINGGTIDGVGINNPSNQPVYANLVNPITGLVVGTTPVNNDGTYTLTAANGVTPNTTFNVVLSTTQGVPGTTTGATPTIPAGWVNTAEGLGGTTGDGTPNGIIPVTTGTTNTTNQDFGIEQPPTAGSGTNTAVNPGGTIQVPVPANTFTNTTPGSDPAPGCVTAIRIIAFPDSATTIIINGTSYTSATFPVAGVVVPTDCIGNPTVPVTVDPLTDTTTKVIIPFVAQDAAGQESPNTGTAVLNFPTLQISGTVHNDINGGTIDGVGINNPSNQPVYANLVNPITGLVVGTTPVNNDGTYTLTAANGVTPNTTFNVVLSTTQGVPGTTTGATPTIPAGWVNTAEGLGGTTGDGTPNGIIPVTTGTTNTTNQDFGIEQPPTAGSGTNTAVNPGGTIQVPVPANTFTNTTPGSDPAPGCVTAIRIIAFPDSATTIIINGTSYTSATFPVAGVVVPTDCIGNPTVPVTVDPISNGSTIVTIPFKAQDAAGQESNNTGTAVLTFGSITISGTIHNDINAGTIDGPGINNPSGQQLYANLVNTATGQIVGTVPVNSNGSYTLTSANGVLPNTSYNVVLSTTQGIVNTTTGATPAIPFAWVNTAEGLGGTTGDGTINGIIPVTTATINVTNQDFGIEQPPTAGSGANSATNPGGTIQVPVPANTFTNITPGSDPAPGCVTAIRITSFPVGAASIVINGTPYTSATFPVAGVVVATDCTGNPTVPVTVDPILDGTITVIIPFHAVDAAGQESTNIGTAVLNFGAPICLQLRVYLEGSLMENNGLVGSTGRPLMRDNLRNSPITGKNYIPVKDPYQTPTQFIDLSTSYIMQAPGTLTQFKQVTDSATVFSVTGENAIVDWVYVELRSKTDSTQIVATRSGLVQRDGDVVDVDGVSCLAFPGVPSDSYFVVIRHRNHLGAMTASAQTPAQLAAVVDFTSLSTPLYDFGTNKFAGADYTGLATNNNIISGYRSLWAGNFNADKKIRYQAANDDPSIALQEVLVYPTNTAFDDYYDFAHGYFQGDYDMNSKVRFQAAFDDPSLVLLQVLIYPLNVSYDDYYDFMIEQIP